MDGGFYIFFIYIFACGGKRIGVPQAASRNPTGCPRKSIFLLPLSVKSIEHLKDNDNNDNNSSCSNNWLAVEQSMDPPFPLESTRSKPLRPFLFKCHCRGTPTYHWFWLHSLHRKIYCQSRFGGEGWKSI
jgi:hypothetical protein